MILYLSGPMTGIPDHNFPAFAEAAWKLRGMGHMVFNPASYPVDPDETWESCMRRDLKDLLMCEGVALLPGWQDSKGAGLEYLVAHDLGMECKPVEEWQP